MCDVENDVYFRCLNCNMRIYRNQMYELLWDEEEEILEVAEEKNLEFWEIMSPSASDGMFKGFGGNIIDYYFSKKICECKKNHNLKIYVEFFYHTPYWHKEKYHYYIEQIEEFIPLESNTLKLESDLLIIKGKEVLDLIHWFIERWVALEYDIDIISPFLDSKACWDPLYNTILKFRNRTHNLKPFSIYTRKTHGFFKYQKSIQKQIDNWLVKEFNNSPCNPIDDFSDLYCSNNLDFPCIHNYAKFALENINYTTKRFHAKYYSGKRDSSNIEVIVSSFNLIKSELNQFETFFLTNNITNSDRFINSNLWKKVDFSI